MHGATNMATISVCIQHQVKATDRFCRLDTERFGIVENITDKDYYTNSFHYDVRKNPTPFEKLDFEKDYPKYCSGGFIHYCEYPVLQQNPKSLEAVGLRLRSHRLSRNEYTN